MLIKEEYFLYILSHCNAPYHSMEQNKDNIITGEYHGSEADPEKCKEYHRKGARMSEEMIREWLAAQRPGYDGTLASLNFDTLPEPDAAVACFGSEAMVYYSTSFCRYFIGWKDFHGMDLDERLRITERVLKWVDEMKKMYPDPSIDDMPV